MVIVIRRGVCAANPEANQADFASLAQLLAGNLPVIAQHDGHINRAARVVAIEDPGVLDPEQAHQVFHSIRLAGVVVDRGRGNRIAVSDIGHRDVNALQIGLGVAGQPADRGTVVDPQLGPFSLYQAAKLQAKCCNYFL